MGNQQIQSFCRFSHWCLSTCCVLFPWVVSSWYDRCFRHWWYCYAIVNEDSLKLALTSLPLVLICICRRRKRMRSCEVSMITLLCLMECNPLIDPAKFLIMAKRSGKVWSLMSNFSVDLLLVSRMGPFLLEFESSEGRIFWKYWWILAVFFCPIHSKQLN